MKGGEMKRIIICLLLLSAVIIPGTFKVHAVTDKEMEQAKVITAKAYLRYANDGSGYLDDVKAGSMAELEKALKAKEKENLKVFNQVQIPGDYASWDKAKLIEFWSVTFFSSPALNEKGKIAKTRVRKQLTAMNVSAPAPEAVPEPATESNTTSTAETLPAASDSAPSAEGAMQAQQDILADQNAIEADNEAATRSLEQERSYTWVYVVILVILICVVIWLVMYAAKVMKRQESRLGVNTDGYEGSEADRARIAELENQLSDKNEAIAALKQRLEEVESRSSENVNKEDRLRNDNRRLMDQIEQLRNENGRLREDLAKTSASVDRARENNRERERRNSRQEEGEESRREPEILKVIYLGRTNSRGIFVRADRRLSPGNTIYRLDTEDGLVGTFRVVDNPAVTGLALSNPTEYLMGGCIGKELDDTRGVSRIVTESPGTAIFENGYWKVLRKTRIRYE